MQAWAIILAAGHGSRMAGACPEGGKQFIHWKGAPLFWHAALGMAAAPRLCGVVLVLPQAELEAAKAMIQACGVSHPLGLPYKLAAGGAERQDSVFAGLEALPPECTHVLVHDSARPFTTPGLVNSVLDKLQEGHRAVIPGVPSADTMKEVDENGFVLRTPERKTLRRVQTPQGFTVELLHTAHKRGRELGLKVTDDAALVEDLGLPVLVVPGEEGNAKITVKEDLMRLQAGSTAPAWLPCCAFGYDVHAYGGGRPFVLGGVRIANTSLTIKAHSDGDVLLHALTDALLGCIAAGDIGGLFPDTDPAFENMNSAIMLSEALEMLREKNVRVTHADMTIIAQEPKVAPFRKEIAKNIAHLLHLEEDAVNVKATTEEGLGFTGQRQGIKATALVSALRAVPL